MPARHAQHPAQYELLVADEPRSRRIHHRLRYRVFCLETGYEDPGAFPDGEERDPWDAQATPFLVRSRPCGHWVAAVRLVLPRPGRGLPIAGLARLDREPDADTAEVSRLSLVGQARRRIHRPVVSCQGYRAAEGGGLPPRGLRRHPTRPVLQAMLRGLVAYSLDRGVTSWYLLVTRSLARLLELALPMRLEAVGPPCWHRGERLPYRVDVAETAMALGREALVGSYARASERLGQAAAGLPEGLPGEAGPALAEAG